MSPSIGAVFISYASEDSEAAARVAEALKAAEIEVWLDKTELRGGEAWDRQIRQQIYDCRLFLAIISANTEIRDEGYFRREWKLAADRTFDMADGKAFLVPVVIDATREREASVPDRFRDVQWLRLPAGKPTPAFCMQIAALLGRGTDQVRSSGRAVHGTIGARSVSGQRRTFRPWHVLAALGLAAIAIGSWIFWQREAGRHSAEQSSTTTPGSALAVLPFIDLSQSHDQEYLADGMAEEILDLLTKIPQLTIIGRTSSFQFKGKNEDLRVVGAKLGAAYIVEGSVRKSGSRVRVTAQLINAQSGSHLWAQSYDEDLRDVLVLQDQVATSIARELQLVMSSANQPSASEPVRSSEAYMLYLRGRVAFDRGDISAYRESQADYEQALALDPTLTRAAEGLLLTYLNLVYEGAASADIGWPRVRKQAQDTIRLDPSSVLAHTALAWVHAYFDYDAAACGRELDTVLGSRPRDPVTLVYSAWIAAVLRRMEVAERLIHQALISDPLNPDAYQALGAILRDAGDLPGAERAFRQNLAMSPSFGDSHVYLAQVLYYRNRLTEALETASAEAPGAARNSFLAGIQFVLGRKRESDALLADMEENRLDGDSYWIATAYTMRAEKDRAFEWLDKAYASHELSLHLPGDPIFAPLRGDPRWGALLQRMKLAH